ncbi:MAG: PatA/PatG family cyanobactin maturation protease [Cyanobacteria bacterium P01_F01_bin.150]
MLESSDLGEKEIAQGLSELNLLWEQSLGDPRICVAILDGPVDESHSCFNGANFERLPTLVSDAAGNGVMSGHGTHITSVIFGQPHSPIHGIAPGCRGLIVPVFSDSRRGPLSQMDLARAINQAVEQGANIINISGGELSQSGEADPILANAVRSCNEKGILIVAAAGNNGCQCLHVPAALPAVLAVGAMDAKGVPLESSNWGKTYQSQGILAPGENILGALPGEKVGMLSGTSFATPIVSGIAALLLSLQLQQGEEPNPHAVKAAILKSALPCNPNISPDCHRFLVGKINISGAQALISQGEIQVMSASKSEMNMIEPSAKGTPSQTDSINQQPNVSATAHDQPVSDDITAATGVNTSQPALAVGDTEPNMPSNLVTVPTMPTMNGMYLVPNPTGMAVMPSGMAIMPSNVVPVVGNPGNIVPSAIAPSNVAAAGNCGCNDSMTASAVYPSSAPGMSSIVYALGLIGYDFGTEARRDSFKQLMPLWNYREGRPQEEGDSSNDVSPANPYDARQMVHYLEGDGIAEGSSLIWTLNLDLQPIYAIEPYGPFARSIYEYLRDFLDGQVKDERDDDYIERVSIPARLTGKTVTLFSGQVVPVIEPVGIRGMYAWKVRQLINSVIEQAGAGANAEQVEFSLKNFLLRIYYDLRNLGQTSEERALNFAATNSFQFANVLSDALSNSTPLRTGGSTQSEIMQLDTFSVQRSPFCRMDSDCWDVKIKFFDPENDRRAKTVIRYTIDVSDLMPVTLGTPRLWNESN